MSSPVSGLREAIEKIEALTRAAKPIHIEQPFSDRPDEKYWVHPNGDIVCIPRSFSRHCEVLKTPQELAEFIQYVTTDREALLPIAAIGAGPGAVMISESAVVYTYAFDGRRDKASVPLVESKQYAWLKTNDDAGFDQKQLEKDLRILFKDAGVEQLHAAVKNLRFTKNEDAEGTIGNGGDSFSRNVTRRVSGVEKLPESVQFRVSLYDNFPFPVDIEVGIAADVEAEEIVLTVYPASLLAAQVKTVDAMKELYDVPAFAGSFT